MVFSYYVYAEFVRFLTTSLFGRIFPITALFMAFPMLLLYVFL